MTINKNSDVSDWVAGVNLCISNISYVFHRNVVLKEKRDHFFPLNENIRLECFLKSLFFRKTYVCFYPSVFSKVFTKLKPPSRVNANLIFTPHISPQTSLNHWHVTKQCHIKAKLSQVWKVPVTPGIASSKPKRRWVFPSKKKIVPQSDTLGRNMLICLFQMEKK